MKFEWDDGKALRNQAKHGVSFDEAVTALLDPNAITDLDVGHSLAEDRWRTIGMSEKLRVLVVITAEAAGDVIRIISARRANKYEESQYEQAIRKSRRGR